MRTRIHLNKKTFIYISVYTDIFYSYISTYLHVYISTQEWSIRTVAEHACIKMGRAAARRNAPKQPRGIKAGLNEGEKKLGSRECEFIRFFP